MRTEEISYFGSFAFERLSSLSDGWIFGDLFHLIANHGFQILIGDVGFSMIGIDLEKVVLEVNQRVTIGRVIVFLVVGAALLVSIYHDLFDIAAQDLGLNKISQSTSHAGQKASRSLGIISPRVRRRILSA